VTAVIGAFSHQVRLHVRITRYASAGAAPGGAAGFFMSVFPLVLIFIIFYFLLIRPQQRR
jgi:preprotein translocase subunit YajC